ncbi:MAG: hypothetical protein ACRBN8_38265 [Nannocystales bacterium]
MGEFSPVQLDALEDALEDLELSGIPLEFEDDVAVSSRLSEYRDLLQLSREALPPVDVPAGVLDSVLAVARDEAALPALSATPRDGAAGSTTPDTSDTPWWKRLSLWVPTLAVGASAALVLVMVQGTLRDAEPGTATVAQAETAEAEQGKDDDKQAFANDGALLERGSELRAAAEPVALADEDDERLGGDRGLTRGRLRGSAALDRGVGAGERSIEEELNAEPEPEPEPESESESAVIPSSPSAGAGPSESKSALDPSDKVIYEKSKGGARPAANERQAKPSETAPSRSSGKKQDAPAPQPGPAPKPTKSKPKSKAPSGGAAVPGADETPTGSLAAADGNRRKGRCGPARTVYRGLLDHDDAKIRARALAGLGLCALDGGETEGAEAYFARARSADSGIGAFISRERDSGKEDVQQAL